MSTFAQATRQALPPAKTLVLEPSVWADTWANRPKEPVCVGFRRMADGEKSKARVEAERLAFDLHPKLGSNWIEAYNDALRRQIAALGICSPNDVNQPSEFLPYAEELVRIALTSDGAQKIFEEYVRFEVEFGPLEPEITDDELAELGEFFQRGFEPGPRLRRLLRHVLEQMRAANPEEADQLAHEAAERVVV